MDKKALLDQLHQLPMHDRMDIVDLLLDSVAFDESPPVTPAQMRTERATGTPSAQS